MLCPTLPRRIAIACLLAVGACGGPEAERTDGSLFGPDAGADAPAPPRVDAVPERLPYPVATLRGTARGARRVVVESSGSAPLATTVLPDGSFCIDVPMPAPGSYVMRVLALSAAGLQSPGSTDIGVEYDPSAPPVPFASTCGGTDPAGCSGSIEICDNGVDDDCDGRVDDQDPDCSRCVDDVLEPNDDSRAPAINPGRYDGLVLCPGTVDNYGVRVTEGQTIEARILFVHAQGNLDLLLLDPGGNEVARSATLDDDESVTFRATRSGVYMLRVIGVDADENTYALTLGVSQ